MNELFIVFAHHTPQASYVYAVRPDGSDIKKIGEFSSASSYWLSPTGKHLAVLNRDLEIIDLSSGAVHASLDNVGQTKFESISRAENVTWDPHGAKIVFLRNASEAEGLEVILFDLQSNATRLLSATNTIHRAPVWSPDGQYVAWASLITPCEQLSEECSSIEEYWNVTVAGVDNANWYDIDLSSIINNSQIEGIWTRSLCKLSWSPNGLYIAFENACDIYGPPLNKEVFVMSVGTPYLHQVTNFSNSSNLSVSAYSLHWHPSSEDLLVAYTVASLSPSSPGQDYQEGVILSELDGISSPKVTVYAALNHTAVWSPDGYQVVWHHAGNPNTLFLSQTASMDAISKRTIYLAENLCFMGFESKKWSPDGQFITTVIGEKSSNSDQAICDSRTSTKIAVVSNDGTVLLIGEQFQGQKQVLGWFTMD
jgi:hypothetical protein